MNTATDKADRAENEWQAIQALDHAKATADSLSGVDSVTALLGEAQVRATLHLADQIAALREVLESVGDAGVLATTSVAEAIDAATPSLALPVERRGLLGRLYHGRRLDGGA